MTARTPLGLVDKNTATGAAVPLATTGDVRFGIGALLRRNIAGQARSGFIPGAAGGNLGVVGTTGWAYAVQPGALGIAPDAASGAYVVPNDGTYNATCAPAPTTGSRIDIIYMGVSDAFDRASASPSAGVIGVASGAASTGTLTAPSIPDGTMEIARNTMTSAATSTSSTGNTITTTLQSTALAGATSQYRTLGDLNADSNPVQGAPEWVLGTRQLTFFDGNRHQQFQGPRTVSGTAERDSIFGAPTDTASQIALQALGVRVFRQDILWVETYYGPYNASTNPSGALTPGWYPTEDTGPCIGFQAASGANAIQAANTESRVTTWNTPQFLRGGAWQFSTANGSFQPPVSGMYEVSFSCGFGTASGQAYIRDSPTVGMPIAFMNIPAAGQASGADFVYMSSATNFSPFVNASVTNAGLRNDRTHVKVKWVGPRTQNV